MQGFGSVVVLVFFFDAVDSRGPRDATRIWSRRGETKGVVSRVVTDEQ